MKKIIIVSIMLALITGVAYTYENIDQGKLIIFRLGSNTAVDSISIDEDIYINLDQILNTQNEDYIIKDNVIQIIRKDLVLNDKYYYANGDIHFGSLLNGMRQGKGITYIYDGGKLEGSFVNDRLGGNGKKILPNGEYYIGDFKDGFFTGYGEYHFLNGDIYKGNWNYGIRDGLGTMYYANKDVYKGEWKNNIHHGFGFYRKESMKQGEWIEGIYTRYVSEQKINDRLNSYKE